MTTTRTGGAWQLDEEGAAAYERTLVAMVMDDWAADLVEAAGLGPGDRVLDVGCGTGIVARHAAGRVGPSGHVTGVDRNPAMLTVACRVSRPAPVAIGYEVGRAEDLPVADAAVDAVLCQQALQFVDDLAAATVEMARVTRPGGRVGASTCRPLRHQPGYQALTEALERHVGSAAADVIRSPYRLDGSDVRGALTAAGFHDPHVRIVVTQMRAPSAAALLAGETASSPLGDVLAGGDPAVETALVADLEAGLAPHTDDDGVTFPFETVVVTATR